MQRIARDLARKYAFDWRDEPLLRVRPGEAFEVEFCDRAGATYGLHTLRTNQLVALHTRGQALRLSAA